MRQGFKDKVFQTVVLLFRKQIVLRHIASKIFRLKLIVTSSFNTGPKFGKKFGLVSSDSGLLGISVLVVLW